MTFGQYRQHIKGAAQQITADDLPGEVGAAFDAWRIIQKVRRDGIPFSDATSGTVIHPEPPRPTEWARRQVERLNTATRQICDLLANAASDDDLEPGDAERLMRITHDSLVSPETE
jgi:hypothetical protein